MRATIYQFPRWVRPPCPKCKGFLYRVSPEWHCLNCGLVLYPSPGFGWRSPYGHSLDLVKTITPAQEAV